MFYCPQHPKTQQIGSLFSPFPRCGECGEWSKSASPLIALAYQDDEEGKDNE